MESGYRLVDQMRCERCLPDKQIRRIHLVVLKDSGVFLALGAVPRSNGRALRSTVTSLIPTFRCRSWWR